VAIVERCPAWGGSNMTLDVFLFGTWTAAETNGAWYGSSFATFKNKKCVFLYIVV